MADLKGKVAQIDEAVVLIEALDPFRAMVDKYKKDTGNTIKVKQGYLSEADVAYELRLRVKDKTTKPPEAIRPLFDPKLSLDEFGKNTNFNDFVAYIEKLELTDFDPPLQPPFTTVYADGTQSDIVHEPIPYYPSKDPRRTGKVFILDPPETIKSLDFQKWIINNSILYGFVVYDTYYLYYVGLSTIQSYAKKGEGFFEGLITSFLRSAKNLKTLLSITINQVLESKPPSTPAFETTDDWAHPLGSKGGGVNNASTGAWGWRVGGFHPGIDLGCNYAQPIYAIGDGVVSRVVRGCKDVKYDNGDTACGNSFGNHIEIKHVDGVTARYCHMIDDWWAPGNKFGSPTLANALDGRTPLHIKSGASVKKGDVIGYCGNTGNSGGCHLHFEIDVSKSSKYADARTVRYKGPVYSDFSTRTVAEDGPRYAPKLKGYDNRSTAPGIRSNFGNPLLLIKAIRQKSSRLWVDSGQNASTQYQQDDKISYPNL